MFYNDIEPFACAWLRNLIDAGELPKGEVDERSIHDIRPEDLAGVRQAHFFAGIGGWPYALRLAGWPDDREVWTGSCPCQPFSQAGKREGVRDPRHLWPVWRELIRECRPATVFAEQVASDGGKRWLDRACADLERLGYAVGTAKLCASIKSFPRRPRLYLVAHTDSGGQRHSANYAEVARVPPPEGVDRAHGDQLRRVDSEGDGLPIPMVHRRRGYGNAIVPQVAAEFIAAFLETEIA